MTGANWNRIEQDFDQAVARYPRLQFHRDGLGWAVQGELEFEAEYNGVTLHDCFSITISMPDDYPESVPLTYETGGRVPRDFHKLGHGALCLAAPLDLELRFRASRSLLGYITDLVIPYLFSFSYYERYGKMPYGERSHCGAGLLEHYREFLAIPSDVEVLRLLSILIRGHYRGHRPCACGSGRRLRNCHGELLQAISTHERPRQLLMEYVAMVLHLHEAGEQIPQDLWTEELQRLVERDAFHKDTER